MACNKRCVKEWSNNFRLFSPFTGVVVGPRPNYKYAGALMQLMYSVWTSIFCNMYTRRNDTMEDWSAFIPFLIIPIGWTVINSGLTYLGSRYGAYWVTVSFAVLTLQSLILMIWSMVWAGVHQFDFAIIAVCVVWVFIATEASSIPAAYLTMRYFPQIYQGASADSPTTAFSSTSSKGSDLDDDHTLNDDGPDSAGSGYNPPELAP